MNTRNLTFSALFLALGIILPQVFHIIGGPGVGAILLPMHIPVILGAILLGPISGFLIGILSVTVGFTLGMPAMPMAVFMFFELSTYGLIAGFLSSRKINVYVTIVITMITGRLVSLSVMMFAINLLNISLSPVFGTISIFLSGIPGAIIQLIIIPPLVMILRRYLNNEGYA